ncbi:hypothetical protein INT48_008332 [Thamnidium elegans]|uniref:Transposase n=1 Tax=Thamnidium elegans TaxID=101142 RepID=A0A8H7SU40_9FUNG|nr:hypothetical protein INT48_008332 [Thamnidium elegans]
MVKLKERISHLTDDMRKKGCSVEEIKLAIKSDITGPVTQLKLAISSKNINQIPKDFLDQKAIQHVNNFISSYPKNYKFKKGSIYYDAIANPVKHLKAYFKLAEICESYKFKLFQCLPLRNTFIPSYMTIDTMILNNQILKDSKRSKLDKSSIWGKVINISNEALKDQGPNKSIKFRGTMITDGVGVSIVKQNFETSKSSTSGPKNNVVKEDFQYIKEISKEELLATKGKTVLIDPGRRDLLYCMHEDSTAKKKKLYRYTRNQKAKELKSAKFRKLRQRFKPTSIQECENKLSQYSWSTVHTDAYLEYLKVRSQVSPLLEEYYGNEDVEKNQRQDNLIPFIKMKLSSYINQIQADKRLSKNLRKKFGNDCILILGNWSACHMKFQEQIRGKGMRKMLRKEGFQIYLLDEYKTSSICPSCEHQLENFKECINPRPYRRSNNPTVKCHGLLR